MRARLLFPSIHAARKLQRHFLPVIRSARPGSPCTRTSGGTFYKCETVNNTKWYDDYNVCCTDGTKYDAADKACCPSGGCNHPCPAGKSWSKALQNCVCPSNVETDGNGNCCASGQVLDENKNCTTPCTPKDCSSYPYTSDPGNSEACDLGCNKGTRYKCKSGYTYSGGKCVEPPAPTPTPKCTDVSAIPNTDRINKSFDIIVANVKKHERDADIACGIPVIQSWQSGFNQTYNNRFMLENPIMGPKYGLHNGKYYGGVNNGGFMCVENIMCSTLAGEGYVDLISGTTGQYCCKQNVFSTGGIQTSRWLLKERCQAQNVITTNLLVRQIMSYLERMIVFQQKLNVLKGIN